MKLISLLAVILFQTAVPDTAGIPAARVRPSRSLSDNESLEDSCSLACALGWEVTSSSSAAGHPAQHLSDHAIETAWVAAATDRAPQVVFSFPESLFGKHARPVPFRGFLICPGFAGVKALWPAYARPHSVLVSVNAKPIAVAELTDRPVDQLIVVPAQDLSPGSTVSLTVLSVYAGSESQSVAIAELVPQGAH
jgi:hypothetical protein